MEGMQMDKEQIKEYGHERKDQVLLDHLRMRDRRMKGRIKSWIM